MEGWHHQVLVTLSKIIDQKEANRDHYERKGIEVTVGYCLGEGDGGHSAGVRVVVY